MKNKQLEPKLLHEDQAIYNSFLFHFPSISSAILALKRDYEALELGEFNDEVYKDFLGGRMSVAEEAYNNSLLSSLNAVGHLNRQIRENLLSNTDGVIKQLKKSLNALLNLNVRSSINGQQFPFYYITIIDGLPVLTEANKEAIKELYCRTYITSESEFELHEKLTNLEIAYNSLLKTLDKVGFLTHFEMASLEQFYSKDEITKEIQLQPKSIRYAIEYNAIYENATRR